MAGPELSGTSILFNFFPPLEFIQRFCNYWNCSFPSFEFVYSEYLFCLQENWKRIIPSKLQNVVSPVETSYVLRVGGILIQVFIIQDVMCDAHMRDGQIFQMRTWLSGMLYSVLPCFLPFWPSYSHPHPVLWFTDGGMDVCMKLQCSQFSYVNRSVRLSPLYMSPTEQNRKPDHLCWLKLPSVSSKEYHKLLFSVFT